MKLVEIIDWRVRNKIDPRRPFESMENLIESTRFLAQYAWKGYRIIRADVDDRKLYWPLYAVLKYNGVVFDYLALDDEDIDWWHVINSKRVYAVDIDNTLIKWDGSTWEPNKKIIELVNRLYDENNLIVIWTARSTKYWDETKELLKNIGVKYDLLVMEKLYAETYIDDLPVIPPDKAPEVIE